MQNHIWGIIGKLLTPGSPQDGQTSRFPALTRVGGANRFLEDLSLDIPRAWFFETVFETENVNYDYIGHLKVLPDIEDHPDHRGSHQQVPGGPEP